MKHTIEIELETPEGWEPEKAICMGSIADLAVNYQIRLRPVWQYPEWLGGAGVAMDEDGRWHVYSGEPSKASKFWRMPEFGWANRLDTLFPLWSPPPCTDWRESWHPNPKWQSNG